MDELVYLFELDSVRNSPRRSFGHSGLCFGRWR